MLTHSEKVIIVKQNRLCTQLVPEPHAHVTQDDFLMKTTHSENGNLSSPSYPPSCIDTILHSQSGKVSH